jgi:conjugal transfer pilin signal peptidase TrbI
MSGVPAGPDTSRWSGPQGHTTEFLRHVRRRWYLYLPVAAIWGLAYTRLYIDPTPRLPVLFNWTASLPYRVALVRHTPHAIERGDYVVFSFAGEAQATYPGLRGQPFFKQVRGLPGDVVTVVGRAVAVNGEVVGFAKAHAFDKRPLEPIAATVIPPGHYYVQGTGPDSFDSRYRSSGLVRADQVIATVVPLF